MHTYRRTGEPLLLAEQLIAWQLARSGSGVYQISLALGRSPRQSRAILYGGALDVATN